MQSEQNLIQFSPTCNPDLLSDASGLKKRLSVFVRVCSKLRNAIPRDEKAIAACENEVDLIRARLFAHPPITDAELTENANRRGYENKSAR